MKRSCNMNEHSLTDADDHDDAAENCRRLNGHTSNLNLYMHAFNLIKDAKSAYQDLNTPKFGFTSKRRLCHEFLEDGSPRGSLSHKDSRSSIRIRPPQFEMIRIMVPADA